MLLFTTVILAFALVAVTVVGLRKRAEHLERVVELLRFSGDDGLAPNTVERGLERLQSRVMHPSTPSDVSFDQLAAAMDEMPTGAVVADASGQVVLRNRVAAPFAGGRHGNALVEAAIQNRLKDALIGDTTDEELRLHGPPERILFIVGSPLIIDGELIGAIVLVDDVSEQHRLDAVRRDFVANVSHELRTPVGALSLLAETLEGETDPEILQRFLGRIQDETERLSRLIDDLLDLSRIEGGTAERLEKVDMAGIVGESVAGVREAAKHKNIDISIDPLTEPAQVLGDHGQLVSAITNLLENAVKYTDESGQVACRVVSHGDEIAVAVVDSGVGIPQKDHQRVFERFYRVDRGRSSTSGGTGLGLAIVRHVAVNHGGRVEVISQEGVGSTFTMILPKVSDRSMAEAPEDEVAHE
jgi:two-component system sensor histidine kinase SenX3